LIGLDHTGLITL